MKIDKVLEAHGIGIVQLNPPVTPTTGVVTNGLVGYWNSRQGVNGTTWANIAPATVGQYDAIIYGATVTGEGLLFDDRTDYVQIPIPTAMKTVTSAMFEMRLRSNGGWADIVNQDGRELIWISPNQIELAGIFDANKYQDHKALLLNTVSVTLHITVKADLETNRVTIYAYNPANGSTVADFYTTTIGTFADGDYFFLSGTSLGYTGIIDSVRLYNRVMTAEEIARNRAVGVDVWG